MGRWLTDAREFWADWGTAILATAILTAVAFFAVSAAADDCRPPLPAGKHYCASLEDTGDCVANPVNAGWKIENKASAAEVCSYLAANPHQEHRYFAWRSALHCNLIGGDVGSDFGKCIASRGLFSAAPYLPAILGEGSIGHAAYCCSAQTGIPPRILAHLQEKEWRMVDCPGYEQWTMWPPHADALAVRAVANEYDVPEICWKWSL